MGKNSLIEKAVQEYEDALENKGAGARIIAAFSAIGKWLRCEKELNDIVTWRKARELAWSVILHPDSYDVEQETATAANNVGTNLAKAYFDAGEDYYFRGFMKNLGVTGMADLLTPKETGDLIACLLILHVVVENCEERDIAEKYIADIEDICKAQLDGENIYEASLDIASQIYQNNHEELNKIFQ